MDYTPEGRRLFEAISRAWYIQHDSCLFFVLLSNPFNIHRRLEAQAHLRQRQAEVAAERRAELAAQKAALLQARIDRGVRVRRAQQLRNERLAAQKGDEREAAAEAARRFVIGALIVSKLRSLPCVIAEGKWR